MPQPKALASKKRGRPLLSAREKTMRDLASAFCMQPARFEAALENGTLHPYAAFRAGRALGLSTREMAWGTKRGGQPRQGGGAGCNRLRRDLKTKNSPDKGDVENAD